MLKRLSIIALFFLFGSGAAAQTEQRGASVNWERYRIGGRNISVLLPKLPVLIQSSNVCLEREKDSYAAYADNAVYGLNVIYKSNRAAPRGCRDKKKFDKNSFADGKKNILSLLKTEQETKSNLNNREIIIIKGNNFTYWLIDDFKNKRWFEFWTTTEDTEKQVVKNFIESFKIEENPSGIEVGNGSSRTLGDELPTVVKSDVENAAAPEENELTPIRIILKPPPRYTEAARQAGITGTVRMRVTFLASGGIGSVSPVSGLPYGLTEQCVAAASKIVFIPVRKKGINVTVTKIVEYGFSIY